MNNAALALCFDKGGFAAVRRGKSENLGFSTFLVPDSNRVAALRFSSKNCFSPTQFAPSDLVGVAFNGGFIVEGLFALGDQTVGE